MGFPQILYWLWGALIFTKRLVKGEAFLLSPSARRKYKERTNLILIKPAGVWQGSVLSYLGKSQGLEVRQIQILSALDGLCDLEQIT